MWQPLPWLAGGSRVLDLGTIVMLVFVAVIVLLGAGLGFGKRKLPPGIRLVLETGILFIFLGAIVGPHGVGLLTESVVDDLMPVLVVALGWIGFLYGSHLEWRRLRRYPGRSYAVAFGQSIFTLLLTLLVALFALAPLIAMSSEGWMGQASAAMLLASAAAGTAPAMLFLLIGRPRMKRQELSTLQFVATLDDVPGIILLALLFAFCNPHISTSGDLMAGLLAVLGMVAIGVASGLILELLYPTVSDERTSSMLFLAVICVASGAAFYLRLSPLVVGVVLGATFANVSPRKETAYAFLQSREKALYVVLLMLAGVLWKPSWYLLATVVPGYVIVRALGKWLGFWLSTSLFGRGGREGRVLGLALLPQGGMVLATAISYELEYEGTANLVVTALAFSVVINEVLGAPLTVRLLTKGGRT